MSITFRHPHVFRDLYRLTFRRSAARQQHNRNNNDQQILTWLSAASAPCPIRRGYGGLKYRRPQRLTT